MGIKQLHNDNLRKLTNEYGNVSVMSWISNHIISSPEPKAHKVSL